MLTDTEIKRENLAQLMQYPTTKTEGKSDNLKRYIDLPKALTEDLSTLQTHFANYRTAENALRNASDTQKEAAEAKLKKMHDTLSQYINNQHQALRSEWATFHAKLTLKNKHTQEKLEAIEEKKETLEPWLQLLLLSTSILDLTLAITLFFAPHLSPITAGIYLTIRAISLICQVVMLNQLVTAMFSNKPLNQKHKVLSASINTLSDALHFSEEEKSTASQQLDTEKAPIKKEAGYFPFFSSTNNKHNKETATPAPVYN
ncbi:MAG: hypothetical protein P1U32_02855 [Legionellaceae bacterium]|nr:hypothetical protein [Legionellaceae bacterium]